ncbi:globin [Naumannella cuiyingiana]|uniref:Hemoglobin n=1 Tax=Naumannella cuiyingiana TaxID=1347891 RepID=A0A7Z0D755_9ACTN|nr:globin [Naumannella cuiyingiana]NYI70104.1 hemoglobin [Naumannella cuiyingiana]
MTNPIAQPPGQPGPDGPTFFERVGGHPTFDKLTAEFYRGVAGDPELRALYPEEDLGPAEDRLRLFLEQYWGGPTTYSQLQGHPRLRMRHAPFAVTPEMRDRWLTHMRAAVLSLGLPDGDAQELWDYLWRAAHAMVNTPSPAAPDGRTSLI